MSTVRDEILQAPLRLPDADRLAIANQLLETLPEDVDDDSSFAEELGRRSGNWEGAISWDQLREEQDGLK